jgi:uncharacterized protein YndB with AHSA1/START domain
MNTSGIKTSNRHGSATVTLPSDLEIVITRAFDAPAALVFKAYTTPELVKRWWGFETSIWLVCEIDLREGGQWRYVTREAEGFEIGFHGEYRSIQAPHRLVSTEIFEGFPDAEAGSLNTVLLEERDGITTMTIAVLHTCAHRIGHGGRNASLNEPARGDRDCFQSGGLISSRD